VAFSADKDKCTKSVNISSNNTRYNLTSCAAKHVRYGGICNDHFVGNLLPSMPVKWFRKSVSLWRSNGQNSVAYFFLDHHIYSI